MEPKWRLKKDPRSEEYILPVEQIRKAIRQGKITGDWLAVPTVPPRRKDWKKISEWPTFREYFPSNYCSFCGKEILDLSAKHCPECGSLLNESASEKRTIPQKTFVENIHRETRESPLISVSLEIEGGWVLLCGLAGGMGIFLIFFGGIAMRSFLFGGILILVGLIVYFYGIKVLSELLKNPKIFSFSLISVALEFLGIVFSLPTIKYGISQSIESLFILNPNPFTLTANIWFIFGWLIFCSFFLLSCWFLRKAYHETGIKIFKIGGDIIFGSSLLAPFLIGFLGTAVGLGIIAFGFFTLNERL